IDVEHADRCSAAFRFADEPGTIPLKMSLPVLSPRVKQGNNLAAQPARETHALGKIAALATPSEVAQRVAAAMLLGDDVLQMKGIGLVVLVNAAILAARAGPSLDQSSRPSVHHEFLRRRRALACRMAIIVPAVT